jgi:hypothetical protein
MAIERYVYDPSPILVHPIVVGPLMRGTVSLCVAMPGVGKSTWAQAAAVAIAYGRADIIGESQTAAPLWPGDVVICYAEDHARIIRKKIGVIEEHYKLQSPSHDIGLYSMVNQKLFRLGPNNQVEFTGQQFLEDIIAWRRSADVSLIVIDTLSACLGGINESNAEQMQAVMDHFTTIAKAAFCSVLLIHHASKVAAGANDSLNLYAGRGSSVVPASVRSVFTLARLSKQEAERAREAGCNPRPFVKVETVKASYSDPTTWQPRWFQLSGVDVPSYDKRDKSNHIMSLALLETQGAPTWYAPTSAVSNQSPVSAFGDPKSMARRVWPDLDKAFRAGPVWVLNTTPRDKKTTNAKEICGLSAAEMKTVFEVLEKWGMVRMPNKEKKEIFRVAGAKLPEIEPELDQSSTGVETEVEPE